MPCNVRLTLHVLLVAAVCALLGSCSQPDPRPNVVVVVMDTLRADHLGCYGYDRPVSPSLDAFAADAVLYEHAYATAPWTLPSHASLFTGLLPMHHGARTYKTAQGQIALAPLHTDHTTLAEILHGQGYRTGAFVANDGFMTPRYQLDQGFETYRVSPVRARELTREVNGWLDRADDAPFFLFVNYMDTHRVYNTRPRPGLLPRPAVQDQGQLLDQLYAAVMPAQDRPAPAGLVQQVTDQYDTAVANVDEQVGNLLAHLHARGLDQNTIVVLTSDHGEYLGEHQLVEHSKDVYEEAVRVPLLIRWPGRPAGEEPACTSLAALPAMLLSALPDPSAAAQLHALAQRPGRTPVVTENYFTRRRDFHNPDWGHRFDRVRTAIYEWPYKLITSSAGPPELYRLDLDPGEQNDLVRAEKDRARDLYNRLQGVRKGNLPRTAEPREAPLTQREEKRLRSLGYLGG